VAKVPVASYGWHSARREIPGGGLEAGDFGHVAQQPRLKLDDQSVLGVVPLGSLDGLYAQLGDSVQRDLELHVEERGSCPRETDNSENGSVAAMKWHRCGCLHACSDGVFEDFGELLAICLKIWEQDHAILARRGGQRIGRIEGNVIVTIGYLRIEERSVEHPQRCAGAQSQVRVDRSYAGGCSECYELRDFATGGRQCKGSRKAVCGAVVHGYAEVGTGITHDGLATESVRSWLHVDHEPAGGR
jgi:hypothetical protein